MHGSLALHVALVVSRARVLDQEQEQHPGKRSSDEPRSVGSPCDTGHWGSAGLVSIGSCPALQQHRRGQKQSGGLVPLRLVPALRLPRLDWTQRHVCCTDDQRPARHRPTLSYADNGAASCSRMTSAAMAGASSGKMCIGVVRNVDDERHLPILYDQAWHTLKVCVARDEWQRVLKRDSSDPYVIVRDGHALPPEP